MKYILLYKYENFRINAEMDKGMAILSCQKYLLYSLFVQGIRYMYGVT